MKNDEYYFWPRMWILGITLLALAFIVLLVFGWRP